MLAPEHLRPRGTKHVTAPAGLIDNLDKDPFSTCMKCGFELSGITKLPKVIDDLSIVLNCGHVLCNKCVHLNETKSLNAGRPQHCQHDFRCCICDALSPPITIPTCVRICNRRYTKTSSDEECQCEVCKPEKPPNYKSRLNNIAFCGIHHDNPVRLFCNQCGKHLCETCVKQNANDFKTTDHTISLISRENERLEDALYNGAMIHRNLHKLQDEAIQGLETFKEKTENVKNTMGCYFIAIINAAIGRYCQLHAAIQCEEEKMKSLVETVFAESADAKKRVEVAREMDELSRNMTLMPEKCTADSYKVSAQKIFKGAVAMHNSIIMDVKSINTHNMQFYSKKSPHETVKAITGMFSDFTTSNANVSQRYKIDNFSKLLSPTGNTVVEVLSKHMELQEADFSTFPEAQKLPDDSYPRFKSAIEACAVRNGLSTKFHPSLIPKMIEEKSNDQIAQSLPLQNPPPSNLPLKKPAKAEIHSKPSPVHVEPVSSTSNLSAPAEVVKFVSQVVTLGSDPSTSTSTAALASNDTRAKKQEELLSMIRSASGSASTSSAVVSATDHNETSRKQPGENGASSSPTIVAKVPWNAKKSSIPYEITSYPVSSNTSSSSTILNPTRKPKSNGHLHRPNQNLSTATAEGVKSLLATVQGMNISKGLLSVLYTSEEFRQLNSPHQYYALKQAVHLTVQEQKRDNTKLTKNEQIYLSGIQHEKLKAVIRSLWESERLPNADSYPNSSSKPINIPQKQRNGHPMHPPMNAPLHANFMLDRRLLPVHRMMTAGVRSLAQIRQNNGAPSNGSSMANCRNNSPLPVKTVQVPSNPALIPPAHRPAFANNLPPKRIIDNGNIKQEVLDEEERNKQLQAVRMNSMNNPSAETLQKQMEEAIPAYTDTPRHDMRPTLDDLIQKSPPPLENGDTPSVFDDPEQQWISQEELDLHVAASASQSNRGLTNPPIQNGPDGRLILRLPRTSLGSQSDDKKAPAENGTHEPPSALMPTVEECRNNGSSEPAVDNSEDTESVRTIDEDGTHRWCYVCNDEKRDLLEEEKGICTTCPRVFHKACAIPKLRVEWSEDDDWRCTLCKSTPPDTPKNPNVEELTPKERHLCQLVLMKCFATRAAAKLLTSYVDPKTTLEEVSRRLEEDAPNKFTSVEQFIKGVNDVFICSSLHNQKNTEKANCTQKVWNIFRKAVKKILPEYHGCVWLYVSLYGTHGNKRKTLTSCTFGNPDSSNIPVKKKRPNPTEFANITM